MNKEFSISLMFSDHMVLQRNKEILIWGQGTDNMQVTISLADVSVDTTICNGKWEAVLPPQEAGGPYIMNVTCGNSTLTFEDVMIGEVWFAGGQSNMELELQNCDNGAQEVANADNEQIRFYNVVKSGMLTPKVVRQQAQEQWKLCKPGKVADVSAVAYFAACELQKELGIAIGVIGCYIGGTSATCWMDKETLMSTPETIGYVDAFNERIGDKTEEEYQIELAVYNKEVEDWNQRVEAERKKNPDIAWEFLNELVGPYPWPQPAGATSQFRPGNPYYAMMERVIPYTIRGFWYYQGEEDSYKAEQYGVLMECLIALWRRKWRDDSLPFILHQLPMFIEKGAEDDKCWAKIREQQALTAARIPNAHMVVLIDCGEFDNIHPTDKQTVGYRLALQTKEHVYGIPCKADSPVVESIQKEGHQVVVEFDCDGLQIQGDEISLFELAAEDGVFYKAEAQICSEKKIVLQNENVQIPQFVRYAWTNYGKVTLFANSGLPVAPFNLKIME